MIGGGSSGAGVESVVWGESVADEDATSCAREGEGQKRKIAEKTVSRAEWARNSFAP